MIIPNIYGKLKNVPNHQPVYIMLISWKFSSLLGRSSLFAAVHGDDGWGPGAQRLGLERLNSATECENDVE